LKTTGYFSEAPYAHLSNRWCFTQWSCRNTAQFLMCRCSKTSTVNTPPRFGFSPVSRFPSRHMKQAQVFLRYPYLVAAGRPPDIAGHAAPQKLTAIVDLDERALAFMTIIGGALFGHCGAIPSKQPSGGGFWPWVEGQEQFGSIVAKRAVHPIRGVCNRASLSLASPSIRASKSAGDVKTVWVLHNPP
jgi:hypothetical protein